MNTTYDVSYKADDHRTIGFTFTDWWPGMLKLYDNERDASKIQLINWSFIRSKL